MCPIEPLTYGSLLVTFRRKVENPVLCHSSRKFTVEELFSFVGNELFGLSGIGGS